MIGDLSSRPRVSNPPRRLLSRVLAVCAVLVIGTGVEPAAQAGVTSSIQSNFNGTAIPGGDTIWFNSVFDIGNVPKTPVTLSITNSTITINGHGVDQTVSVPNAEITFSPTATQATTTFNAATNTWDTTLPTSKLSGNDFLDGVGFKVPAGGFPGGINSVTWTANFSASSAVMLNWKWGAGVYTSFSSDNNALGVKPVDATNASKYMNSDHAGTPENYASFIIGGARGGGGSNCTGSYSGTASLCLPAVPEPSSLALAVIAGTLIVGKCNRDRLHRRRLEA